MEIKDADFFKYYKSETEPPNEGPKLWLRPSDGAHFSRSEDGWKQYVPINMACKLKAGESVDVTVPNP